MNIALITGASSGLGKEFIKQLKKIDIDEIWAVARREERLLSLSGITDIKIRPIAMDLTVSENIDILENMLKEEKPHIRLLINAAGFGKIGRFDEISRFDVDRMIDLNCKAAVDVTLISIPFMQKKDRIIEVCSTAAFQPFQYLNVYAASKSFLYRFSRALRYELYGTGIKVTAVCPYWIKDTEFIPVAKDVKDKNRRINHFVLAGKKDTVAAVSLFGAKIGIPVCTPGIVCTAHRIVAKFVPSFIMNGIWEGLRRI